MNAAASATSTVKSNINYILTIIGVVIIIIIIYNIYKAAKTGSNIIGQGIGNQILSQQTGVHPTRINYLRQLATDLWDNAVSRPWYAAFLVRDYDEQKFIDALNSCMDGREAKLLSQFYKQASGESLRQAVNSSFSAANKAKVNSEILLNIE
jgi:hypothetical protein